MSEPVKFWEPAKAFAAVELEIMAVIREVLAGGDLVMRQQMMDFERHLAEFVGTADAVGVSNCTDGLRLTLEALGVGAGDEVITVSHTFLATLGAIHASGATPVLVDVGEDHNMDVDQLEAAVSSRTKVIMPVHLNGRLCRMDRILELANAHDLLVVEDTAQALGASYDGIKGGAWGVAGVFSFYPAKLLGAYGDAGAVVTSDPVIAARIRELRDHGRTSKTTFASWGSNNRLDNLQAAVLDFKLRSINDVIARRRHLAGLYDELLNGLIGLKLPPGPDGGRYFDVYQNYAVESEFRDELAKYLADVGVETMVSPGPIPNHHHPIGLEHYRLPRTERLCQTVLSLPLTSEATDAEVELVSAHVQAFRS